MHQDAAFRTPRTLGSRTVYANPWMRVREDDLELSDGTVATFGIVERADFAVVLPRERDGFWMVEQYRHAIGRRGVELPMGAWPPGHAGGDALALARAELAEETGLRAGQWRHLGRLYAANGYSPAAFDAYLATDLQPGRPDREPTEADMVNRFVPDADLDALIDDATIVDAPTLAAIFLYQRHLRVPDPAGR